MSGAVLEDIFHSDHPSGVEASRELSESKSRAYSRIIHHAELCLACFEYFALFV